MARSSTTYPAKWQSGKTTVIRVPKAIAKEVLAIARRLDASRRFRVRDEPGGLLLELDDARGVRYTAGQPVNVASIPQRSPFRYPGGKTWLIPYIRQWLKTRRRRPSRLIEPFAGGAIVSLTAAFERLAKHVLFAELDDNVAAVWRVVLNGGAEWLAREILDFEMSFDAAKRILDTKPTSLREKAFQTILKNRVQRGGIMAPGAGLIKAGDNGRGLHSRWSPETLARRIREINQLKDRLSFVHGNGLELIEEHKADKDVAFYIDPPYTLAARRLYTSWQMDHSRLFAVMRECKGDFLMSYDNTPEIAALASKFGFESRAIAMKNTHHARMTELLIGRKLSWVVNSQPE
jgi:DNA adenine methylase